MSLMPSGVRNPLVLWTPESLGAGSTFPGAKMLHDVTAGEGSWKGEKCWTQSWSELQVMPGAGSPSLG